MGAPLVVSHFQIRDEGLGDGSALIQLPSFEGERRRARHCWPALAIAGKTKALALRVSHRLPDHLGAMSA